MNVEVTQTHHPQEKTGTRFRTLTAIAMTAVAAMTLAGAKPAFTHGVHVRSPGSHTGGKIYCSAGTGVPVKVTPPEVGPVTNVAGERVWWTYRLMWLNSGTGQWQWLEPYRPWREYRRYLYNGRNQFWDDPVARVVGRPFYFSVAYWVFWGSASEVRQLGPSEAWQGVNNTGWAGGPNHWFCRT
jgi:hypothetical protein